MNYRLQLHKERLRTMLGIIEMHERYEDTFDFDQKAIREHEHKTIVEYCAEFAALTQLAFNQIKNSSIKAELMQTDEIKDNPVLFRYEGVKEHYKNKI